MAHAAASCVFFSFFLLGGGLLVAVRGEGLSPAMVSEFSVPVKVLDVCLEREM